MYILFKDLLWFFLMRLINPAFKTLPIAFFHLTHLKVRTDIGQYLTTPPPTLWPCMNSL